MRHPTAENLQEVPDCTATLPQVGRKQALFATEKGSGEAVGGETEREGRERKKERD